MQHKIIRSVLYLFFPFCALLAQGQFISISPKIFLQDELLCEITRFSNYNQSDTIVISGTFPGGLAEQGPKYKSLEITGNRIVSKLLVENNGDTSICKISYEGEDILSVASIPKTDNNKFERKFLRSNGDSAFYLINGKYHFYILNENGIRHRHFESQDFLNFNGNTEGVLNVFGSPDVLFGIDFSMHLSILKSNKGLFRVSETVTQTEGPDKYKLTTVKKTRRNPNGTLIHETVEIFSIGERPRSKYNIIKKHDTLILKTDKYEEHYSLLGGDNVKVERKINQKTMYEVIYQIVVKKAVYSPN